MNECNRMESPEEIKIHTYTDILRQLIYDKVAESI